MDHRLLLVEDITYHYPTGNWELLPSSFCAISGEILGIIGPNGSGKSTLLKLAAGVLNPDKGRVLLLEQNVGRMKRREVARLLGYLPQHTKSYFDYSVEEVVATGRFPHTTGAGFLSAHDVEVITNCLAQTEMESFRRRSLSRLSGGERQRALLASVIAQEPKVLLLDEPTSALDIHHQMRFFSVLSDLVAQGMAVVVVTHDLNLASLFSDRLIMLQGGKIAHQGRPGEILSKEILSGIYGYGLEILRHPTTSRPIVLPVKETSGVKGVRS